MDYLVIGNKDLFNCLGVTSEHISTGINILLMSVLLTSAAKNLGFFFERGNTFLLPSCILYVFQVSKYYLEYYSHILEEVSPPLMIHLIDVV